VISVFDRFFTKKETSAEIAKGRLLFTIAHERASRAQPDYFAALQKDLIQLISKYVKTDLESVQIQHDRQKDAEILNIVLPETDGSSAEPKESAASGRSWMGFFKRKKPSAQIARERLLIMIARDEFDAAAQDYFPRLQKELTMLVANHMAIDPVLIKILRERQEKCEILNVVLPDGSRGQGLSEDR